MLESGRNLTHQLTHELGAAIVQGQYSVGKNFPTEAELSQQFKISRSVTREAVKMLTAKGLIASRPRQGIRVMPGSHWNMFDADVLGWMLNMRPSLELLREFTQLRFAIEPEAAALAARCHNDGQAIFAIADALARMKNASQVHDDPLATAIDFHCAILAASHNRFFYQLREFTQVALRLSQASAHPLKEPVWVANYDEHKPIYDAIVAGDSSRAAAAARDLLDALMAQINRALAGLRTDTH